MGGELKALIIILVFHVCNECQFSPVAERRWQYGAKRREHQRCAMSQSGTRGLGQCDDILYTLEHNSVHIGMQLCTH